MSETLKLGRILFIGAHADDIEIGCGGTAAKWSAASNPVAFAIATLPSDQGVAKVRKVEASKAASLLQLSESEDTLFFGKLLDGELNQKDKELRNWLKDVSNKFKPDTIFLHRNDDHTDHQSVYKVGIGVFQDKNIFLYYIPRPSPETPFNPNHAEDISNYINKKVAMCKCHATQPADYISPDSVRTNSHFWYQRWYQRIQPKKKGYAEPFITHASRSTVDGKTANSNDFENPSTTYDLRVIKKSDGTLTWKD